ncbi:BBP7 family outer membrane beta-barrel protein [Fimbriiglobus ruber]|uniref:Uncharacterized protein n=1 Tax=Fimbriiglobus ruber TaxID=1908690 RepID=A0A225D8A9_9BACT|nr:BBP7 family outer membrane beta-barrel protein [Fimbriiglobus ruber]OWK37692.1 hypothetical protein FRUB_06812 [Fimbriiglobus ruber]
MRNKVGIAWICLLGCIGVGSADDGAAALLPITASVRTKIPQDAPPIGSFAIIDDGIPSGVTVSRPLQPVFLDPINKSSALFPSESKSCLDTNSDPVQPGGPLGQIWVSAEYLLWWPKSQFLPPLVTAAGGGAPAVLGGPNTTLLVGGTRLDNPDASGTRINLGVSLNESQTIGMAVTYLFLASRTATDNFVGFTGPGAMTYGRPFVNAQTGAQDVIPVSIPGSQSGTVRVAVTSPRLSGWEVSGVGNLYDAPGVKITALAGYRYFMMNEGVRIDQYAQFAGSTAGPPVYGATSDQFEANNRFHGGQFGLTADLTHNSLFLEATGKIALGQAITVVRTSGQTEAFTPGYPYPALQWYQGGVLAQPSNSGRFTRSGFAVLPEATVKLGYKFQNKSRVYVGYNFLYLSDVVRAGNQIDTTIDPSQLALFSKTNTGQIVTDRPAPLMARSDFWAQGLMLGLEYRY